MLHKYPHDYKVVFVGDASMSPYEITAPGGSVEHFNEEAGAVWLQRLANTYPSAVWLNPTPEQYWGYSASTQIVRELMHDRMYPLDEGRWLQEVGLSSTRAPTAYVHSADRSVAGQHHGRPSQPAVAVRSVVANLKTLDHPLPPSFELLEQQRWPLAAVLRG